MVSFFISLFFFEMIITLNCVGLIGHLKKHFLGVYNLYVILKNQSEPPTDEEKAIAAGQQMLDLSKATQYLNHIQKSSMVIIEAFKKQQNITVSSFLVQSICITLKSTISGVQLEPRRI